MTNGQHLLFYRNPARCWEEALPLGNGRIGAMVYGRADEELIELNEDTLWGGRPRSFDGGGYFEQLGEAAGSCGSGGLPKRTNSSPRICCITTAKGIFRPGG